MRLRNKHRVFVVSLLLALPAHALTIEPPLPDAAQERNAQTIFHQLKCMVCEGQALADSDAALAIQMRAEVRRMAAEGQSEAEILDYFRARYGARILFTPPFEASTWLLWLAPLLLLAGGGFLIYRTTAKDAA
ncbi:MAG: cytochrome c-type biogenesis protein CcmH [Rickettsiales bacterium]